MPVRNGPGSARSGTEPLAERPMSQSLFLSMAAIAALIPAGLAGARRHPGRDGLFWVLLIVAVAGPLALVAVRTGGVWRADFSTTLWTTVAASMAVFGLVAAFDRQAWRLAPLMAGYLIVVAVLAAVWQHAPQKPGTSGQATTWVAVHIAVSVATYALVTIAAVAALAAFLQERALKAKRPTALTRALPAVADCEALLVRLLIFSEIVLGMGLVTGMGALYLETGNVLTFDHKTVLTMAAFVVIGGLLFAHFRTGMRGRKAARVVLLGYLLLTLGYPGVKFVTDVLLAR